MERQGLDGGKFGAQQAQSGRRHGGGCASADGIPHININGGRGRRVSTAGSAGDAQRARAGPRARDRTGVNRH